MDNDELDVLLKRAAHAPPVDPRVAAAKQDLMDRARLDHDQYETAWLRRLSRAAVRSHQHHRAMVVGAVAAVALVLTAGTTVAAAYLQIPPFQSLPEGYIRTSESIPLNYITQNGTEIKCRTFLEFERTDQATVDRVDQAIAAHDWSDFGQRIYDAIPGLVDHPTDILNPQDEVQDASFSAISNFAQEVIPGLVIFQGHTDAPGLAATATTCRPDAQ